MAQLAVIVVRPDAEVDISPCRIGVASFGQAFDHLDYLADLTRRPGVLVRPEDVQAVHLCQIARNVRLGEVGNRHSLPRGSVDHLVVYIGEVLYVPDPVPPVLQVPSQNVEYHRAHRVAHVSGRIGCDAADVDRHHIALRR